MSGISTRIGLIAGIVVAVALGLSACGGDDNSNATAQPAGNDTVAVATVGSAGSVLVDADGRALYTPEQESSGKIVCTGSCETIWKPLTVDGGSQPTASSDVGGDLGTVKRPDGAEQVTVDGAPLYTFTEEGANEVTGDGLSDSFGGHDFTWHVVTASGGTGAAGGTSTTTTSSSNGRYGY